MKKGLIFSAVRQQTTPWKWLRATHVLVAGILFLIILLLLKDSSFSSLFDKATLALVYGSFFAIFTRIAVASDFSSHPIYCLIRLAFSVFLAIIVFAIIYAHAGLTHTMTGLSYKFSDGLYFSIVTWSTVGYGDFIVPEELRITAAFEALLGMYAMGILIGLLVTYGLEKGKSREK